MKAGARLLQQGRGNRQVDLCVADAGVPEVDRLHRLNEGLGILAAVGPMLGLLGTVIGMIGAFRAIGTLTGTARSNQLATFMSMALVNTAEGLIVAIPCTIAFALFRRRIEVLTHQMSDVLERLVRAVPSAPPRIAAPLAQPSPRAVPAPPAPAAKLSV